MLARLFVEIEDRVVRGHLWIGGPPGSGKTMLAVHYAARLTSPVVWCEFDLFGIDPISFFLLFPRRLSIIPGLLFSLVADVATPGKHADPACICEKIFPHFFPVLAENGSLSWIICGRFPQILGLQRYSPFACGKFRSIVGSPCSRCRNR